MEQEIKQSEFVVSEDTAKWVRALKDLQEVWCSVCALTDYENVDEDPYYPHFRAIEKLLAQSIGETVAANFGFKAFPKNMI